MRNLALLTALSTFLLAAGAPAEDLDAIERMIWAEQYDEAVEQLLPLVESENHEAQNMLGELYDQGRGVERSPEKALELYRKSAEGGFAGGQNNLGVLYRNGEAGLPVSNEKAFEWFEKAAQQGVAWAQYNLAVMYGQGVYVEKSFQTAAHWLGLAAAQDHDDAQKLLWYVYGEGIKVDPNDTATIEWLEKQADGQSLQAQMALANAGFAPASLEAGIRACKELHYMDRAQLILSYWADQGIAEAQFYLAEAYNYWKPELNDPEKALAYYQMAAQQEHPQAMYRLGRLYREGGVGLERDYGQALYWLEKAAEKGSAAAYSGLTRLYLYGRGPVPLNEKKAQEYAQIALSMGNNGGMVAIAQKRRNEERDRAYDAQTQAYIVEVRELSEREFALQYEKATDPLYGKHFKDFQYRQALEQVFLEKERSAMRQVEEAERLASIERAQQRARESAAFNARSEAELAAGQARMQADINRRNREFQQQQTEKEFQQRIDYIEGKSTYNPDGD